MPAVVNRDICNACEGLERQECIFSCPYEGIVLVEGKAFVDDDACQDCKLCIEVCPVQAIVLV